MNYKVIVSYDGTNFHGWAKQKNVRTVQQEIEELLTKIFNQKININVSGRTDAFVHAIGQVFSFKLKKNLIKPSELLKILNNIKPDDIEFISIKKANDKFHARFSSKSKVYKYVINTGKSVVFDHNYVLNYDKKINLKVIKKAAKLFIGKHDFKSFSRSELDDTIREIKSIKIAESVNQLIVTVCGNGFLRNMVRMIIGSLLDINENKKTIDDIKYLLKNPKKGSSITKVRANGLYLVKVNY